MTKLNTAISVSTIYPQTDSRFLSPLRRVAVGQQMNGRGAHPVHQLSRICLSFPPLIRKTYPMSLSSRQEQDMSLYKCPRKEEEGMFKSPRLNVQFQNATTRAEEQWLQTSQWLSSLTLMDLVNGYMGMDVTERVVGRRRRDYGAQTRIQIAGTDNNLLRGAAASQALDLEPLWFLGLPPRLRMQKAHDLINAYYAVSPHKPFPSSISSGIYASDASMLPAAEL
ncbi:hypothetical protein EV421DRAFT_1737414 [Armillaria borealis]|uniref:Uncharacterized protein n=1 Tax=Armillaria borealis TaxID=47425 RepID=A0AA39MNX1_9AGAR|nr:hypothetical protein EV421DRAFT_1737414 [Armillaria borealis]